MPYLDRIAERFSSFANLLLISMSSAFGALIASIVALVIAIAFIGSIFSFGGLFDSELNLHMLFKSGWFPLILYFLHTYIIALFIQAKHKESLAVKSGLHEEVRQILDEKLNQLISQQRDRELQLDGLMKEQVRAIAHSYMQVETYAAISGLLKGLEAECEIILQVRRGFDTENSIYHVERNYVMDRKHVERLLAFLNVRAPVDCSIDVVPVEINKIELNHSRWTKSIDVAMRTLLQESKLQFPNGT